MSRNITPERIVELRKMADSLCYDEMNVLIALAGLRNHQEMIINMIEDGDMSPSDVANTPDEIARVVDDIEGDLLAELNILAIINQYNLAEHYVVEFRPVLKLEVVVQKDDE